MDEKDKNPTHIPPNGQGKFAPHHERTKDKPPPSPIIEALTPSVSKTKKDDTLIDVHIGNPLEKITKLLEDIKKQKAFTFTLKGSLGIMGVVFVASAIGIFGGSKMLCDKGIQSKIGTIKILTLKENVPTTIIDYIPIVNTLLQPNMQNRYILIMSDQDTIQILTKNNALSPTLNLSSVIVSGNYDSCASTIEVTEPSAIESIE